MALTLLAFCSPQGGLCSYFLMMCSWGGQDSPAFSGAKNLIILFESRESWTRTVRVTEAISLWLLVSGPESLTVPSRKERPGEEVSGKRTPLGSNS